MFKKSNNSLNFWSKLSTQMMIFGFGLGDIINWEDL